MDTEAAVDGRQADGLEADLIHQENQQQLGVRVQLTAQDELRGHLDERHWLPLRLLGDG